MILPTKHIPVKQSLVGLGAQILPHLERARTLSELWERIREIPEIGNFRRLILVLDMLYAIGAIELKDGLLRKARS